MPSNSAREGMADVGSSLTPDGRRDIAWALRTSLAQVTPGELGSSALADSWQRASDWLCRLEHWARKMTQCPPIRRRSR